MNFPKFQIFKGRNKQFYFRLCATNGQIILQSEGYKALKGCENGIASVKKNSASLKNFNVMKSPKGIYFTLIAANKEIIGRSETYKRMESCKKGIASVKKNSKAEVEYLVK